MHGDDAKLDISDVDDKGDTTNWKIPLLVARRDIVSNFSGMVTARAEYSTGCTQYLITPLVGDDGAYREPLWFDEDRLWRLQPASTVPETTPTGGPQRNPAPVK